MMTDFMKNLYVPFGTGRPGVRTDVHIPEVEPEISTRGSNFLPYSSLYHTVYPPQTVSRRRRRKLYKWSVVGALILLVVVMSVAGALLVHKSKHSPVRVSHTAPATSGNLPSTTSTSGKTSTESATGTSLQEATHLGNVISSDDSLDIVKSC